MKKTISFTQSNSLKKYRAVILLLLIALILFNACNSFIRQILWWNYGFFEYEVKDFNKKHCEIVSDELYDIFENELVENDTLERIVVHPTVGAWDVTYYFKDEAKNFNKQVQMTTEGEESIGYIYKSFNSKYGGFGFVSIHKGRVTFRKLAPYAIIHCRNGRAPEYFMLPGDHDEREYIYLYRKLAHNWYQGAYIKKDDLK